ncbi:MAG: peptide deformylase [Patescibacteria group bacterium]|nr:peptide deformylase [Patescibacteria group bacterium]MDE2437866.1 peptide deformylase [Patescibacteria group bacterium]
MFKILTIHDKQSELFLRKKTNSVSDPKMVTRSFINEMKKTMIGANGIGLAANQIGNNTRIFVATHAGKFYVFINPILLKSSTEEDTMEEGCLSVPNVYGAVTRASKVVIQGIDVRGKLVKLKAVGLLARIFQHELDHLNGTLFIDKASETYSVED